MTSLARNTGLRLLACAFFLVVFAAHAQQTVFNVPSADIMDKGKTYLEWDTLLGDSSPSAAVTPRTVHGLGHGIETGINVSSFNAPVSGPIFAVPTIKWKFYESTKHGLVLFAGDNVVLPIRQRTFNVGNAVYLEAAKTFSSKTRIGVGIYDFSAQVIDHANRAGIQASLEQEITPRFAVAADWYSGNNSVGFVTPGLVTKVSGTVTLLTACEMGNHDLMQGNHAILLVLGWNPAWGHSAH